MSLDHLNEEDVPYINVQVSEVQKLRGVFKDAFENEEIDEDRIKWDRLKNKYLD
jgi:hypothetical protein